MYTASDLRKGLKVIIDGEPYIVTAFEFSKPGKGQALYRTKLRNMITGLSIDRTYREGETFEPASLEERVMQFLYKEGDHYHFMITKATNRSLSAKNLWVRPRAFSLTI